MPSVNAVIGPQIHLLVFPLSQKRSREYFTAPRFCLKRDVPRFNQSHIPNIHAVRPHLSGHGRTPEESGNAPEPDAAALILKAERHPAYEAVAVEAFKEGVE